MGFTSSTHAPPPLATLPFPAGASRCSVSAPAMTPHCQAFANSFSFLRTSILAARLLNYPCCWYSQKDRSCNRWCLERNGCYGGKAVNIPISIPFERARYVPLWTTDKELSWCVLQAPRCTLSPVMLFSSHDSPPHLASRGFYNDLCRIFKNHSTSFKMWHKWCGFWQIK